MARPRRVEGVKTAQERMEDAFWEMLAEMPYHEMTGRELRRRAGVSHNTFYYHFASMDDMARQMFRGIGIEQGPPAMLAILQGGGVAAEIAASIPNFAQRYHHVCLMAGSASPMIISMLHDAVMAAWINAVGLKESDLTPGDRIDLEFAFGGVIALMGSGAMDDPAAFVSFAERQMGAGVLAKMLALSQRRDAATCEPCAE